MELTQINSQLSSLELFELFKAQLKKDFSECACNVDFIKDLEPNFEMLQKTIDTELTKNAQNAFFNLNQLLYRIDISEKQIRILCDQKRSENYLTIVSELIIKRILQKVILKKHFSN